MLDNQFQSPDAKAPKSSTDKNENLNLTDLVPPPTKRNGIDLTPDTWEFKAPEDSAFKYLSKLMTDDNKLNQTIDSYFGKADLDKNGFVNKDEVNTSSLRTDLSGEENVVRSLLGTVLPIVQIQHNDEFGIENDGATKGDVTSTFDNWMKFNHSREELFRTRTYIPAMFNKIDSDGDGFLTEKELGSAKLPESNIEIDHRRELAVDTLKKNFSDVRSCNNDGSDESKGLSLDDVRAYSNESRVSDKNMFKLDAIFNLIARSPDKSSIGGTFKFQW